MAPGSSPPADPPATAIQAAARLLADGEVGEAARQLEALVQAAPAYPAAHVLLAKAHEAAERWEDALGAWHQAYFLVPGSPLVRRERQRLLDAQVRAALPADWPRPAEDHPAPKPKADEVPVPTEPASGETTPTTADEASEVEELDGTGADEVGSEPLAEEPGGTLPDAHQVLAPEAEETEPEPAESLVAQEAPEAGSKAVAEPQQDESGAVAEPDEAVPESDAPEPDVRALPYEATPPYDASPPYEPLGASAGPDDLAEPIEEVEHEAPPAEAEPIEPEEVELFGVDEEGDALWVSPGPAVSRALDEPPIEPPDLDDEAAEPVAGTEGDAGWWQRTASAESDDESNDIEGWTIVDETEVRPTSSPFADAAIAPPTAAPEPDEPEPDDLEPPVEDARVVDDEPDGPPEPSPIRPVEPEPNEAEEPTVADELDALIQQLEDAPRIRPDPAFQPPSVVFDERIADDMVSETLARIYAAQHQYAEAAIVYEKLAQQKPERAEEMLRRAAELRAQGGHA